MHTKVRKIVLAALFLLALPAFGQTVTLPFTPADGIIFLDVRIDGASYHMLMDTGSASTFIGGPTLHQATEDIGGGLRAHGRMKHVTVNLPDCELGAHVFEANLNMLDGTFPHSKIHINGILGEDLLARFASVRIDYKQSVIELQK